MVATIAIRVGIGNCGNPHDGIWSKAFRFFRADALGFGLGRERGGHFSAHSEMDFWGDLSPSPVCGEGEGLFFYILKAKIL
jgi:hypothetical protein